MKAEPSHQAATAIKAPWNKGKMIGSKPPLRIKNVWSIRTKLQVDRRLRDLAMFNLAIDSKLRAATSSPCGLKTSPRTDSPRSRHSPPEKNRTSRPVRANGADTRSHRRLHESDGEAARRQSLSEPALPWTTAHDKAVRAARLRLDLWDRPRRQLLWHPLAEADQGYPHLQANRQSPGGAALAGPPEDREHGPLSRYRGR